MRSARSVRKGEIGRSMNGRISGGSRKGMTGGGGGESVRMEMRRMLMGTRMRDGGAMTTMAEDGGRSIDRGCVYGPGGGNFMCNDSYDLRDALARPWAAVCH